MCDVVDCPFFGVIAHERTLLLGPAGAIFATEGSEIHVYGSVSFAQNTALDGGMTSRDVIKDVQKHLVSTLAKQGRV